jgi:hypothetical protein
MEFEDHYVTCGLKYIMGQWLWCAVLLNYK